MATAQVKNSFSSIGEVDVQIPASALTLKLSVNKSALRYFVVNQALQQIIFFGEYTIHHAGNPVELAERIEKIYRNDEIMQLHFSKVVVGLDEKYSLVPSSFSFLINRTAQLSQTCFDTEIVFENPKEIMDTLLRVFPKAEFRHLNATYFYTLLEYSVNISDKLFVNVSPAHLDIILYDTNHTLKIMNRYSYQAASDFIYFVLLCCDELRIDREQTELVLIGEVDIQSKIYDLCYRYFKQIAFIQKPENIQFSKAFDVFPKHLHFNLYNL